MWKCLKRTIVAVGAVPALGVRFIAAMQPRCTGTGNRPCMQRGFNMEGIKEVGEGLYGGVFADDAPIFCGKRTKQG